MARIGFILFLSFAFITLPGSIAWSKEGHVMTCQIAQVNYSNRYESEVERPK